MSMLGLGAAIYSYRGAVVFPEASLAGTAEVGLLVFLEGQRGRRDGCGCV
jgi:hypothetical protein